MKSEALTACERGLDPALLARTATVVRDRRNIADRRDHKAGSLKGAQRRFTARARSANLDFEGAHAVFLSLLGAIFGSDLCGERGRLTRTLETLSTCGRPGNSIALSIRDGDHGVVERRIYVGNARRDVFTLAMRRTRVASLAMIVLSIDLYTAVIPAATPVLKKGPVSNPTGEPERPDGTKTFRRNYFFLPAIAFAGPLRVRALVCVR